MKVTTRRYPDAPVKPALCALEPSEFLILFTVSAQAGSVHPDSLLGPHCLCCPQPHHRCSHLTAGKEDRRGC